MDQDIICVAHMFMLVPRQCSFKASTELVNHPGSDNCAERSQGI